MFGNPFPVTKLCQFLTMSAFVIGIPASADQPAWWTQVGADGQSVISSNAPVSDPKSPANIGQAKFMAKRALEALHQILPSAASNIEANLVGAGKAIPTWDAPVPGSSLAKAQFAPLLLGQLKAIAEPFYSCLKDVDSEWLLMELSENGTLDSSVSDNFYPWTASTEDDSNKSIATIGQLKAVFSLRFESLVSSFSESDTGEPDDEVVFEELPEESLDGVAPNSLQSSISTSFQSVTLGNSTYDIQFRRGVRKIHKEGFLPIHDTSPPSKVRYLNLTTRYFATDPYRNRLPEPWRVGHFLPPNGHTYDFFYTDQQKDVVNPLDGTISSYGTSLNTSWWEKVPFPIADEGPKTAPTDAVGGQWHWWGFGNGYDWGRITWHYDTNPWYSGKFDGDALMWYEKVVSNENTLEKVKKLAMANPPPVPLKWSVGSPTASWNVWKSEMGVTYSITQFRFRHKSGAPLKLMANVVFSPESGAPDQLIKTVKWNGVGDHSAFVTMDPAKMRPNMEGQYHIEVGTIDFDLDQSQNRSMTVIPIDGKDSGGGSPRENPSPTVTFPGMNQSWFDGQSSITIVKVAGSGKGQLQFKAGNKTVPFGDNLVPNFFRTGGSWTGQSWTIEGIEPGELKVKITYERNGKMLSITRSARVIGGDVDIDSDNSGAIDRTIAEENIENDMTKPGQLIVVQPDWLNDADGIPNTVDGLAEIRVDAAGFLPTDEIVFHYSASTPGVSPPRGALRIWKKPLSGPPASTAEFIVPGHSYTLSNIGLVPGTTGLFYVQAVSPTPTKAAIKVQLSANGVVVQDTILTTLIPVDLISDLNNDGQITAADNPLRDAAMAGGATDEIKDKGTEFIFHNDTLSNGIWDKEDTDPARPATEKNDDDAEEITINPGITEGEVWLDHPAIAGLSFYKTRECNPADKVNLSPTNKFAVSASNPFPDKLFMRADGNLSYPEANPQFESDLVLKIKVGTNGQGIEAVKMKLTVVRHFGAIKFFNAARDYIFERNVKLYVCERIYKSSLTRWRLCVMAEDLTSLQPVETYHGPTPIAGTATKPVGPFGFNLVAAYNSDFTVLINGPQVFFDYGFGWPVPIPPSKQKYFALVNGFYNPNPIMTDKSHGRFVIRNSDWLGAAYSELSPTSSDDTAQPKGSELAGDTAEYVSQSGDGLWEFGTGRLPLLPAAGVGGLSDNHASPDRINHNTALIGHAEIPKKGVGCVFVATHKPDSIMAGVNISEFVDSSITSKVDKNSNTGTPKLYMTDGGYATVALAHKTPNDDLKTVVFGPAVNYPVMVGQGLTGNFNHAPVNYHLGVPYYTNVYIGLKSEKPRN